MSYGNRETSDEYEKHDKDTTVVHFKKYEIFRVSIKRGQLNCI